MSKMSEMDVTIEDLRKCASTINYVANWLAEAFSSDKSAKEAPDSEPALKLEAVRAVLAVKSRAGFTAQIHSLLQKYGANKLSEIDPANYKALLDDVEVMDDAT